MSPSRSARPSQRRSANRRRAAQATQADPARVQHHAGRKANRAKLSVVESAPAPQLRASSPSQELLYGSIGLSLKLGLALVAVVSLVRLAGAYQERLDRYGEVTAVLDIQKAKLLKAQNRFDRLFSVGGEQKLIQEQDQWIAPNRLRVVWKQTKPDSNQQPSKTDPIP